VSCRRGAGVRHEIHMETDRRRAVDRPARLHRSAAAHHGTIEISPQIEKGESYEGRTTPEFLWSPDRCRAPAAARDPGGLGRGGFEEPSALRPLRFARPTPATAPPDPPRLVRRHPADQDGVVRESLGPTATLLQRPQTRFGPSLVPHRARRCTPSSSSSCSEPALTPPDHLPPAPPLRRARPLRRRPDLEPFMDIDVFPTRSSTGGPSGMIFLPKLQSAWMRSSDTRLTIALERPGASGDRANTTTSSGSTTCHSLPAAYTSADTGSLGVGLRRGRGHPPYIEWATSAPTSSTRGSPRLGLNLS